jgi:hypothetical protein
MEAILLGVTGMVSQDVLREYLLDMWPGTDLF